MSLNGLKDNVGKGSLTYKQNPKAGEKGEGVEISIPYDCGDNLDDFVSRYGEDTAWFFLMSAVRGSFRNWVHQMRTVKKRTLGQIVELATDWKPVVPKGKLKKNPLDPLMEEFKSMDKPDRAELINDLNRQITSIQASLEEQPDPSKTESKAAK